MQQLLILGPKAAAETRRRIEQAVNVVQEGSERLLVVEGSEDALRKIAALPGVSTPSKLSADTAKQLSSGERTFLDAWRKQAKMATKKRAGQGLSWSAKGYRPP
jgi:hypothetical protein